MKEADIQKSFMDEMEYRGAVVVKINNGGIPKADGSFIPPRQKGVSDTLICYKGYYIAVEFKMPGDKPTAYQEAFIEQVKHAGGIAFWSSDAGKAVQTILEEVKKKQHPILTVPPSQLDEAGKVKL